MGLVEFGSVVDAVRCVSAIQHGMIARNEDLPEDTRIVFRIGELDASFRVSNIVERVPLQPPQDLKAVR